MDQITFSEAEYQTKKGKTRGEIFLERMDKLISWKRLEKKVARYYPKGQNGRPPYPFSAMRHFVGMKLDRLPDETSILNFRYFMEQHGLGKGCLNR